MTSVAIIPTFSSCAQFKMQFGNSKINHRSFRLYGNGSSHLSIFIFEYKWAWEFMTGPGWRQARERGLRSVADLRRPFECDHRTGDPVVPGDILAGVSVHATPIEDHDNAGSWQPAARLGNDYANCCFKANAPSGTRRHPMRPGCWTRRAPCRLPAANSAIPVEDRKSTV